MSVILSLYVLSATILSGKPILILGLILFSLIITYISYNLGIRHYFIRRSYKQETWLPVTDDKGNIIGRVAQSVSMENPGKYQHPLVRMILWCNGKLYLKPRSPELLFENSKMDLPFEIVLKYGEGIEEKMDYIHENYFSTCNKPLFLLKYAYENEGGKWQVFLYYINIPDENLLGSLDFRDGKLWPVKQIKENIGKSYFSKILENELAFSSLLLENS
jgi:hypothetical protein